MKKSFLCALALSSICLLFGCSGSKNATNLDEVSIPDWYLNPPKDANYIYAPATAVSKDLQISVDKASTDARAEIGRTIELKLNNLQKRFDEEVGVADKSDLLQQFTQATKIVVSTELNGSQIIKKLVGKEGETFRAYVLTEYPIGAALEAFTKQISKQQELYTRFRASETFKELDDEVKKYEEWKKTQH
jgi:hypothetical protein